MLLGEVMNDLEALSTAVCKKDKQNNSVTSAMQKKVDQASVPSSLPNITVFESMFVAKKAGMKFFWEYIQMALPNETSSLTNKDLLLFFGQYT